MNLESKSNVFTNIYNSNVFTIVIICQTATSHYKTKQNFSASNFEGDARGRTWMEHNFPLARMLEKVSFETQNIGLRKWLYGVTKYKTMKLCVDFFFSSRV